MPMLCADLPLGAPCGVGLHGAHVGGAGMGIRGPRLFLRMSPHVFRTLDFGHEASFPGPRRLQPNGIEGDVGTWSPLWHQLPT